MPQFMDQATAEILYRYKISPDEPYRTYDRSWLGATAASVMFSRMLDRMVNLGIANNSDILLVGGGFGFLIETAIADGRLNTATWRNVEPGSYFWDAAQDAEWGPGIKAMSVQDFIQSPTIVSSLQSLGMQGQARSDFIITEDCITMHSDGELTEFLDACEARLQGGAVGRIIHVVSTTDDDRTYDSMVNGKTLQEWHDVRPQHTWVRVHDGVAMRNNTVI